MKWPVMGFGVSAEELSRGRSLPSRSGGDGHVSTRAGWGWGWGCPPAPPPRLLENLSTVDVGGGTRMLRGGIRT